MTAKEILIFAIITLPIGTMIFIVLGQFFAKRIRVEQEINASIVESSIFALFGLLLAFTFTGAVSRFEARRTVIVSEAISVNSAYRSISTLPKEVQPQVRDLFNKYTSVRSRMFQHLNDKKSTGQLFDLSQNLQDQMWQLILNSCNDNNNNRLCFTAISEFNQLFKTAETDNISRQNHPPEIVYYMLALMNVIVAFFVGFNLSKLSKRNLLYLICYTIIMPLIIYIIIDLETPRAGFFNINQDDQIILGKGIKRIN